MCGVLSSTIFESNRFNFSVSRVRSDWPSERHRQQHLPGLLGIRRSSETEERIPSAADGGCIALAAVGRAVHGPRRLASWVKLCPDHRPPPRPIGEINRRLWDLLDRLGSTRCPGHGTSCHLKGCRLRGKSPVGAVAADSAAKGIGSDLFSFKSAGPAAVILTRRKKSTLNPASETIARGPPAHGSLRSRIILL